MIIFQNVSKVYSSSRGKKVVLNDLNLQIEKGEFVSVVGKSGAGKTTIAKLLIGEEKPSQGKIIFGNNNVADLRGMELQRHRRKMGVVFQDYKLLSSKTVLENLSYMMEMLGIEKDIIKKDVDHLLDIVGLEDRCKGFPCELSGGECQRLAIARALISRPEVVIADEPTGNLDPYNTYEIIGLFKKINELGTTVLLFTHDKEIINSLKKRVITLDQGRIVSDDKKGKFVL